MYEKHKHLINQNKSAEFSELFETDDLARASLVSIFNYLECIALAIEHDLMDSSFIKGFFRGIFISFYNDYDFYITYRRKKNNAPLAWINFTTLAHKWSCEN